jgi:hypothetical protein
MSGSTEEHVESLRNVWLTATQDLCKKHSEQGTSSKEQAATYATYTTYAAARDALYAQRASEPLEYMRRSSPPPPPAPPEDDADTFYSRNVDHQGTFTLHLSASDYETLMGALTVSMDSPLVEEQAYDSFVGLHSRLMDWNHCDVGK